MAEEFSNPQPPQPGEEAVDRLGIVEDRITGVEEELRIRSIEERLDGLEGDDDGAAKAPLPSPRAKEKENFVLRLLVS